MFARLVAALHWLWLSLYLPTNSCPVYASHTSNQRMGSLWSVFIPLSMYTCRGGEGGMLYRFIAHLIKRSGAMVYT